LHANLGRVQNGIQGLGGTEGAGKHDVKAIIEAPLTGKLSIWLGRRLPRFFIPVVDRSDLFWLDASANQEIAKPGRKDNYSVHASVHKACPAVDGGSQPSWRNHSRRGQGVGPKILYIENGRTVRSQF